MTLVVAKMAYFAMGSHSVELIAEMVRVHA